MHRKTTKNGINLIKKYEGFSGVPYLCSAGYPTIGYGHLIKPNEDLKKVSIFEAEEILKQDLISAEKSVLRLVNQELEDSQFDALVSFCFNLGAAALQRSTLRQKLNRGEYQNAAQEFKKWVYANGKKIPGLVRRREEESQLFSIPIFHN